MTDSYILYLQTDLPVDAVLERVFEPKSISPLEGTNLLYARGHVYLAHAQPLPDTMQERYLAQFGFPASISIRYFPDGVSSVKTAMTILAEGIMRWLHDGEDNLLLSANNTVDVIKRLDGLVMVNTSHQFWQYDRLKLVDLPYHDMKV